MTTPFRLLQLTAETPTLHTSARQIAMHTCQATATLEHSLSFRMKEVYEERKAGEDLDAEYGNNVGGPPKNRRAGAKKPYPQCLAMQVLK